MAVGIQENDIVGGMVLFDVRFVVGFAKDDGNKRICKVVK